MIANSLVNHRLPWWSYPVVLVALAALACRVFTLAQDRESGPLPIDYEVSTDIELVQPLGQTDQRFYKHQRSKLGVVVLAFDLKSRKLAWSSEIELPAVGIAVAGRQFLLHTGGGVVTVAVVGDDNSLQVQEIDAEIGKVTAECRLTRSGTGRSSDAEALYRAIEERRLLAVEADQGGGQADQASDRVLQMAREQANELVSASSDTSAARLTVETAGTVWRQINGNAPIESVRMVREGGKDRMIIEGKGKKHLRIILEIRTEGDKNSPSERGEEGTPSGSGSERQDDGASDPQVKQPDERPSQARKPLGSELRRAWLDIRSVPPTENQVAVAALCWAVKEQMRDKPFTPWLSDKPIQVDWPLDERFERFAALDLFGVLPQGVNDDHLRRAWLDLYGLPLTDQDKEKAALNWIKKDQ